MYSLQGKGRGRRRRNATEGKDLSPGESSVEPAKRSTPDKAQPQKAPPTVDTIPKLSGSANNSMSNFMQLDNLENDFPTSGLMQSDTLPGFDGQSIDDYLDSNYISALPGQHDFDPGFYFGNHCGSLDSTPVDSLSGE